MANFDNRLRIVWRAYDIECYKNKKPLLSSRQLSKNLKKDWKYVITADKIANLVDGRVDPEENEVEKLADFFGVSSDWLCGADDTPPENLKGIPLSDYDRNEIFGIAAAEGASGVSNFELREAAEFQAITPENNNV